MAAALPAAALSAERSSAGLQPQALPIGRPTVDLQPPSVLPASGLAALGRAEGEAAGDVLQPLLRAQEALQTRDVEHQSELAGTQRGLTQAPADLQLPTGNTLADEAFRRSAVVAAQARVGLDARANVLDLVDKHQADPQGFQAALEAGSKAYVAKLPPDLQGEAAKTYDFFGSRGFAQVHEKWKSEQVDAQRATVMQAVDGKAADAANMARAGDYAGALAQVASLHDTYAAAGPLSAGGSGALSAVEIERHHEAAADNVNYNFVRGLIDHSGNKATLLKGLESGHVGDPTADQALSALKPETRDRLIAATRQEMAQDRADARQAAAYQEQGVAINRQLFMEGRAQDQIAERANGVRIDDPITRSEFMAHYPGKAAAAGAAAWVRYQHQATAASVKGEFLTAPADVLNAHVEASAPTPGEPDYADRARYYDALVEGRSATLAARETNPVEATIRSSPAVAQAWATASADPTKLPQAVQASIAEQQRLGIKNITPLPQGAVSATVGAWHAGQTAAERLAAVAPLTIGLGKQNPDGTYDDTLGAKSLKQLEKAGLDPGTNYALEAARQGDGPRAHEIIGWLAVDPKNLPDPGEAKAKEVKAAVAQLYQGPNAARAEADAYALTGQPGAGEAAQRGQALLLRGALIYAARGEQPDDAAAHALRVLHGDKPVTTNPDVGIVPLPPGVRDAAGFENALALTRENVDLAHLAPTREGVAARLPPGTPAGTIEGVLAQAKADHDALAADVRNGGGRWLAAPGGYQLITPHGQAVPGPDGRPRVWTADEITHHAMTGGAGAVTDEYGQRVPALDWSAAPPAAPARAEAPAGMVTPGNIDLHHRPVVHNADGSVSTVRSMSFEEDGKHILVPTVAADGSGILSEADAIAQFHRTGQHLGVFRSEQAATAYAERLHEAQAREYTPRSPYRDLVTNRPDEGVLGGSR